MWTRTLLTALACSIPVALLASTIHAAPSVEEPDTPAVAAARAAIATCPEAGAPVTAVPPPPVGCDPTGPIVALGDSDTYGYGVTMVAYSTPPPGAGPAVVQQLLGIPVVNAGVNGDTALSTLRPSTPGFGHRPAALQLPALLALHPRLVIVGFGMAEAVYGVPIPTAAADLDALLRALGDVPTVIVGSHVDCSAIRICRGGDGVRYTSAWDDQLRVVAARHHSGLVLDVEAGLAAAGEMTDELHPTLRGYRVMAGRIAPVVGDRLAAASRGWRSGGRLLHS
ncbi:MAG TPA: GDSL-type esterase/lipase family protein [Candidatus Dormibacteraeota bacterium]